MTPTRPWISLSVLAIAWLAGTLATAPVLAEGPAVTGTVRYQGPPIQRQPLRMGADPKCEEIHGGERVLSADRLVSDQGGVADVFVFLREDPAGSFTKPTEPARLVQDGCMYLPRVLGLLVGQPLEIHNDDPTLHNVRCLAKENRPFNLGQPADQPPRTKVFTEPEEAIKLKCDVHPWMAAHVFVMEHPFFAVSDDQGRFSIEGLPAGSYRLHAWHESFGELEQEIQVKDGAGAVQFVYSGAGE